MRKCSVEDCMRVHFCKEYCVMHYRRWKKFGDPAFRLETHQPAQPGRLCKIEGCGKRHSARGYCATHYRRWQIHGDPNVKRDLSRYEGRKHKDTNGYILVKAMGHPNRLKRGHVYEHVLVMSEYLNRPILKGETIHHKNGIRDDNRLDNLELWSTKHGKGQRITDQLAYMLGFIYDYQSFLEDEQVDFLSEIIRGR